MLKLTVKPGEYLMIGDDIKLVFTGGSSRNMRILVDAPKSYKIVRSPALEKYQQIPDQEKPMKYYKEPDLSPEAKERIKSILMEERRKQK